MRQLKRTANLSLAAYSWQLPDADSDLLFGNVTWPVAETLARLLVDADTDHLCHWTPRQCMSMGKPN